MLTQGLMVRLDSRAGNDHEIEDFLHQLLPEAQSEMNLPGWFALRFGRAEYGMFSVFSNVDGRDRHLAGALMRAVTERADRLFARQPRLQRLAILADTFPTIPLAEEVSKALLLTFKPKNGHAQEVENFLRDAKANVLHEPRTSAWFALMMDDGDYGVFDLFPDNSARFAHLTGQVPRALARHSLSLMGGMPELHLLQVLAAKIPVMAPVTAGGA